MLVLELLMAGAMVTTAQPATVHDALKARVLRDTPVVIDNCKGGGMMQAAGKKESPKAQRLGDLPKAYLELPVSRTVDGCVAPLRSRYTVGK